MAAFETIPAGQFLQELLDISAFNALLNNLHASLRVGTGLTSSSVGRLAEEGAGKKAFAMLAAGGFSREKDALIAFRRVVRVGMVVVATAVEIRGRVYNNEAGILVSPGGSSVFLREKDIGVTAVRDPVTSLIGNSNLENIQRLAEDYEKAAPIGQLVLSEVVHGAYSALTASFLHLGRPTYSFIENLRGAEKAYSTVLQESGAGAAVELLFGERR